MTEYTTSQPMRLMIEQWEGLRLEPYADAVGVPTIGYGHTGEDVQLDADPITQEQADQLLEADLKRFEDAVNGMVSDDTSQQQFDAMVSFSYNLGEGALRGSTLLRMHNAGDWSGATQQFGMWVHAGGRTLPGLVRRRHGEAMVYANGDYGQGGPPAAA